MKAVIAKKIGGPEVLQIVEIDQPEVKTGEVKIQVKAFGLNKVDGYYRSGVHGQLVPDQVFGIEAVGVVAEDPSGTFNVGQKVATAMGGMMFTRHGGYAEYIAVNVNNVMKVDSDISFEELAALPESYLTAWGALDKNLKVAKGESLLIRGATSSVGLSAVVYAKYRGLSVIATTRNPNRVESLKALGADHVLIDNGNIHEQVKAIYPAGVNNALEVVGASTVKDTLKTIAPWGEVAVVGLLGGPPIIESFNLMTDLPNTIKLSWFDSQWFGTKALPLNDSPLNEIAQQIVNGTMQSTIAKVFPFEEIQEAHRLLDSGAANGKIVVTI